MKIESAKIVRIMPTTCAMQHDFSGGIAIVLQHEGCEQFEIARVNYNYLYTSNSHRFSLACSIVELLGFDPKQIAQTHLSFQEDDASPK